MKKLVIAVAMAIGTGCGSNAKPPESVYEARDRVDEAGAGAKAKIRPAVRPVIAKVDRGVEDAVASVGLRDERAKDYSSGEGNQSRSARRVPRARSMKAPSAATSASASGGSRKGDGGREIAQLPSMSPPQTGE